MKYAMPSVAISSVTPSWLTSLPSTSRSITHATATISSNAAAKASRLANSLLSRPISLGIHSEKRAIASAANSTIAPCAKLNTPEALKISTKPSATRLYSMPVIRPPIRVSRKKPMLSGPAGPSQGACDPSGGSR